MSKISPLHSVAVKTTLLIVVALSLEGLFFSLFTNHSLEKFIESSSAEYRVEIENGEKSKLHDSVELAYGVIKSYYDRSQNLEALKEQEAANLKRIIDTVTTQVNSIYQRFDGILPPEVIRERIKAVVEDAKYDGNNYIWIHDMNNRMVVHPNKSLVGKDLSGLKDPAGTLVIAQMTDLVKKKGEGTASYLWPRPGEKKAKQKISYVKLIPELGWVVGTGSWVEDITAQMKQEALAQIAKMRLGDDKYFWINDYGPRMVMHPLKPGLNGKDISSVKDSKGKNLFVEMVDEVKNNNGEGFVKYWWDNPATGKEAPKISFVKEFKPWGWIIGMGVYVDNIDTVVTRQRDSFDAAISSIEMDTTIFDLIFIVIAAAICILVIRQGLNKPLANLVDFSSRIATGDLESSLSGKFKGEMETLKVSLEHMVRTLKNKIAEANKLSEQSRQETLKAQEASEEAQKAKDEAERAKVKGMHEAADLLEGLVSDLSTAFSELSALVQEVTHGTENQQQRVSETAVAMEEMNATVMEVARSAAQAAESADLTRKNAEDGSEIMDKSVEAILTINSQTTELQTNMNELGTQAEAIGSVMNVITDIADQTNLLALNAAIEAARAGEAGRGFAVVADEVRKLAEKTMDATREVGEAINNIQRGTAGNIDRVKNVGIAMDKASDFANESKNSLGQIIENVASTSDQVRSIATASEQQSHTSDEINRAVDDIKLVSGDTAEGMTQASLAIDELAKLSLDLQELITKLRDTE
ncbi:cache domain-containing protein [Maridesulfovibrio sp.]|uniref:methyl-accepting chemotaxis protein n=1 Tax=Maridesulfovibrio sp. TaxID=2795000 RepID=UPI002A189DC3|nr:cache domain-containing protein [Maridesulfovibrio sp.]